MARSDRAVRVLLERYLEKFPDEAARALEHLPLRDVAALLASQSAPLAGRGRQQLAADLAADGLAALEPDALRRLMSMRGAVRAASRRAGAAAAKRGERPGQRARGRVGEDRGV